jgi:recombinational DNA repair protein (RecF pathway)
LRYQTQVGYQLRLDLIAGRQWRLVGAAITNEFAGLLRDREKLVAVTALYRLLERLIHGEEPHPELFWELEAAFCFLAEQKLGAAERRAFLLVAGLRVLYHLGYVASVGERAAFLPPAPWMSEWLVLPPAVLKATQRELAQSLQSSGL